jgi:exodeoxyribonuclease VII small subunit
MSEDSDTQATQREAESESPATFEESLGDLERIVSQLEEGNLGLSESLALYEKGVQRLRECYALLSAAEQRIELVTAVDEQGRAITEPFDASATSELEAKGETHSHRQSKPTKRRSGQTK